MTTFKSCLWSLVSVSYRAGWWRGVAARKSGPVFTVHLLDLGFSVKASSAVRTWDPCRIPFFEFSTSRCSQLNSAAKQAPSVRPTVGEIVLAYKYKVWTRAEVVEVLINNCYKLRLFDLGVEVKVGLGDIYRATQDLMNVHALVSNCAIVLWTPSTTVRVTSSTTIATRGWRCSWES